MAAGFSCTRTLGMKSLVGAILILFICASLVSSAENDRTHLHADLFFERCRSITPGPSTNITCDSLWDRFLQYFQCDSNQCDPVMDRARYESFIQLMPPVTSTSQAMFYSEVDGALAERVASRCANKRTIHGTFLGQLFDNLAWCCNRGDVVDHPCGRVKDCNEKTLAQFWTYAFQMFSANAKGEVAIILDGSGDDPPYSSDSYFSTSQLPYLTQEVRTMTVILVYGRTGEDEDAPVETKWKCDSEDSGLTELQIEMLRKRISFNCTDDPMWSSSECSGADILVVCSWLLGLLIVLQVTAAVV